MSHTYTSMRIHVIFSTKERQKRLREEIQTKLWACIAGIARHHGFEAIEIGGAEDHCHALILLPAPMPLSKAVQTLKGCYQAQAPKIREGFHLTVFGFVRGLMVKGKWLDRVFIPASLPEYDEIKAQLADW